MKNQFVLFLFIGVINTLFSYGVFALLIFYKLHYTIAVMVATILGVIFNFNTFGRIVFKKMHKKLFLKFICVYGVLYFINIGLFTVLSIWFYNKYVNGAFLMILCAALSYILNKHFVFKDKNDAN